MVTNDAKKELRYAKNVTITSKYIILYRGSSVAIYDRRFVCLKKILNLKFVYKGYVSSDEQKLLLVSNTNRIYIVSLDNFTLVYTYTVPKPYNGNLEGLACWCSRNSFLLPIQNSVSMLSAIRKICCDSESVIEDFLSEIFWIIYINFVECKDQYLLIGLDRNNHCWDIIWLDKENKYTIHEISGFNEAIFDIRLIHDAEQIILTGETKIHCCYFNGFPSTLADAFPFDVIKEFGYPSFFKPSQENTDLAYFGTHNALVIWNLSKKSAVKIFEIEFGAQNVEELENMLLVSTYNGIKLFSLPTYAPV